MESFLENLIAAEDAYRASLEMEGLSGDELVARVDAHRKRKFGDYYGKTMELLSEDEFQDYRRALEAGDGEKIQSILSRHAVPIVALQQDLLDRFAQ